MLRLFTTNGGSLLAWAMDEELTDTKLRYQFDKAKPFRSRHAQQIKLIDEPVLPTRDLDELYSDCLLYTSDAADD